MHFDWRIAANGRLWRVAGRLRWWRYRVGRRLMGHGGCECWGELMQAVTQGEQIMPRPHWCQDVAMVGFYIDCLRDLTRTPR